MTKIALLAVSCNFTHPCIKYISTILLAVNAYVSNSARESNNQKKKEKVLVNILVGCKQQHLHNLSMQQQLVLSQIVGHYVACLILVVSRNEYKIMDINFFQISLDKIFSNPYKIVSSVYKYLKYTLNYEYH